MVEEKGHATNNDFYYFMLGSKTGKRRQNKSHIVDYTTSIKQLQATRLDDNIDPVSLIPAPRETC